MSWFYRTCLRPALFAQDSESIHNRTLAMLGRASRSSIGIRLLSGVNQVPELPVAAFGLRFPNPVGLAAGMDKNGVALPAWAALGFGFTELGGVTWHAQPGNPAPRMFRAVRDEALVNRMGFNNAGAEAMARNLIAWRQRGLWPQHPVGINLGKSKITPLDKAAEEYAQTFELLRPLADFFVLNVSSPNTPNLRQLQDKAALEEIVVAVQERNSRPGGTSAGAKPILIKISPDLSFEAIDEILALAETRKVSGIVATNTTTTRPVSTDPKLVQVYNETGGLSGRPLAARSTEIIRHIHRRMNGRLPIIGVGGIFSAEDAWQKIEAGATLLQIYSGLVYEGPGLVKDIVAGLRRTVSGMVNP